MKNQIVALQNQIKLIRDNLNTLELRQAKYGLDIPISLINEVKELRTESQKKEQELHHLLQIQPEIHELYSKLDIILEEEDYEKAVNLCDQIAKLYPGYRDVLEKRMLAQSKLDEKKQQEKDEQEITIAVESIANLIKDDAILESRIELISLLRSHPYNEMLVALAQKVDLNLLSQQHFAGRDNLLTKIKSYIPACLRGQGSVLLVTGEPGAGKTYLVSEFVRQVQAEYSNIIATFGACSPYGDASEAYEPFREALNFLVGTTRLAWDEDYMSSLENFIRVFRCSHLTREAIIEQGPGLIDTFISSNDLGQGVEVDQSTTGQTGLFHQFTSVIEQVTKDTPLIFVLDDFQWANLSSIHLFSYLARNARTLPLLLIVIYRNTDLAIVQSDKQHPFLHILSELKRRYGDIEISISSSTTDTDSFVKDYIDAIYTPHKFHSQFVHTIAKRTRDNALFISELLQYLNDNGSIYPDETGNWVCPKLIDIDSLPARIEAVIEERISRLEDNLSDILISASVEGEEFTAQVLSSIQKVEERQILKHLTQSLSRRYRLIEEQGARIFGKRRLYFFRFRHILFQQYIYNSLTDVEKEIIHQDVGLCLEELCSSNLEEVSHLLVRHFREAHMLDKVVKYSAMAAQRMAKSFAYHEAISFYNQILEATSRLELDPYDTNGEMELDEVKAKALQGRGDILLQLEKLKEAIHDYEQALTLDVLPRVELLKQIGRAKEFMGFWNEAFGYYQECIESYRTSKNELGVIEINIRLGAISKQMGDWDKALGFLFQALEQARKMENEYWEARTACNIGMVYYRKQNWDSSLSYYKKDLDISRKLNDLVGIERSLANTGEVYLEIGNINKAIESMLEAIEINKKLGGEPSPVTHRNVGVSCLRLNDIEQAERHLQISLDAALKQDWMQEASWTLYEIGKLQIEKGNIQTAKDSLVKSIEYAEKINDRWRLSYSIFALAQIAKKEEKTQEAISTLEKAHTLASEVGDSNLLGQITESLNSLQSKSQERNE